MEPANIDDALRRLVSSIAGDNDDAAESQPHHDQIMALAHRIVASRKYASMAAAATTNNNDSNLRRVERSHGKEARATMEGLHRDLARVCGEPTIADDVVAVLSKVSVEQQSIKPPELLRRITKPPPPPIAISKQATQFDKTIAMSKLDDDEVLFIRECLYALQGINGQHVQLQGKVMTIKSTPAIMCGRSTLNTHSRLGSGAHTALRQCAETGWYYSRVQQYVNNASNGFCTLALAQALRKELHEYHRMIATMDYDLQQDKSTLILRQVLLNLAAPNSRLRILAMLTDGLALLRGGQLLTGLYRHSLHGDTRHASLVTNLLLETSKPWFHSLYMWTTQGILLDPFEEFFIFEDENIDDANMWNHKYSVDVTKVPLGIMNSTLVEPTLLVGKGIRFIRNNLQDLVWRMDYETNDEEPIEKLGYTAGGSSILRAWLIKAADQVNSHILGSLRADLLQNLWALKQFLLLGQGDFFSVLMTGLHAEFESKVGIVGIYTYVLMGIVESAIKSTNAAEMPTSVLNRLQVELDVDATDDTQYMFAVPNNGSYKDERTGWDIFLLKYVVPDRLTAILGEEEMKQYRQVFSMLFGMKRVEFMLTLTWRQSTTLQHSLQTFAQYNGISPSTNEDYAFALLLLRRISMTRQSMNHFVTNLKSYLFFEVLEASWKLLFYQIEHARSLDEIISAHNLFLKGIIRKGLLNRSEEGGENLSRQIKTLLGLSLRFCKFQEQLFNQALEAVDRSAEKRRVAEMRIKDGEWGFVSEREVADEVTFFGLVDQTRLDEVNAIYDKFNAGTLELMEELDGIINGKDSTHASAPGTPSRPEQTTIVRKHERTTNAYLEANHDSLRFLTFQLDYSSFYNAQTNEH